MLTPYGYEDSADRLRDDFREGLRRYFGPAQLGRVANVFPPVNIYDNGGEGYLVRAELPGIDKDQLDISCKGDQLVLRGERVIEAVEESANYHRRERESGQFRRTVTLPHTIDAAKVSAKYRDGILEIYAPRAEDAKPRKVKIST